MHHLYPLAKGDPLCPLGFHPQVRWPTRCKRCFRDYKEHGGKKRDDENSLRRDDNTSSTPSLNSWDSKGREDNRKNWASSSNLANNHQTSEINNSPASWTSTPDLATLEDDTQANIPTISFTLPKRKQLPITATHRAVSDSFSLIKPDKNSAFNKNDNLATRVKKLQAIKDASQERTKRIQIKEIKPSVEDATNDVQFLIQVKTKPKKEDYKFNLSEGSESDDDTISLAGTETTDTTLVGDPNENEYQEQIESLKEELDATKTKCEKLEREKSDILLRRLAAMETTTSKTTATEVLKLQQRCNDLQNQLEDIKDDRRSLNLKVKELEDEMDQRPTAQAAQKVADELRSKLMAAENLCEELMDENEDMKKELRDLEEEIEEMQDNFREDQADEYSSLKKELEQTTKNCRILSFKLRKTERKSEQLENEKNETEKKLKEISGGQSTLPNLERMQHLEQDLKVANDVAARLQKDLDEANSKLSKAEEATSKKKAPKLESIGKGPSGEGRISRESLTRGGSQDDPAQLLRDLQDSLEREADLREQLKFAEEEAQNLRKKASRIEDDNESLVLQLKKMANKARSRKLSPTNVRLTPETSVEKNEGISADDPAELKLILELNEQEAAVLRRKAEELETEKDTLKRKVKDLQDKLAAKSATKKTLLGSIKEDPNQDHRVKVLEDETSDLRKKLIEKERDCERLHAELSLTQKRPKGIQKSKSLDLDQQTLDLRRQLQVIEQEAVVLRSKVQSLEADNEKMLTENKRLQLRGTKTIKIDKSLDRYIDKIAELEIEVSDKDKKITELEEKLSKPDTKSKFDSTDVQKLKIQLKQAESERDKLANTLSGLKDDAKIHFRERTPKKPTDFTSKANLKTMVHDLESEIGEIIVMARNAENVKNKLEEEMKLLKSSSKGIESRNAVKECEEVKQKLNNTETELIEEKIKTTKEKAKIDDLNVTLTKTKENLSKAVGEKKQLKEEKQKLKDELKKINEDKYKIEEEIRKMKNELETSTKFKDDLDKLSKELQQKEKEILALKKDSEEKLKLSADIFSKNRKITDLENQVREAEDHAKKIEKLKREEVKKLEATLEQEQSKNLAKDSQQFELSSKWTDDRQSLNSQIQELSAKIKSLETQIASKNSKIEQLEETVQKEKDAASNANLKITSLETTEINKLKSELKTSKTTLNEVETKLEITQSSKKTLEDKLRKTEIGLKKDKITFEKKIAELEIDLQTEKKKSELFKTNQEKDKKNKEAELVTLRNKIKTLESTSGAGTTKITEIKKEYEERIDKLETSLSKEKREYDDLTAKYEILEEEHVVTKAKLVMDKETLNNQLTSMKRESENLETQLKVLRETYNSKQDTWIKEKLEIQEKLKEMEKTTKLGNDSSGFERARLKASLEEKQSELEQLRKEYDVINNQMEYMRRENDELKKKLDDFDKVSKIQRNISADSSAMEKEIRTLGNRLANAEKARKTDLAECKMRYDSQITAITAELQSLQAQVTRFKRERDTYKHMLEGAQKTIGDLKNTSSRSGRESRSSISSIDEFEDMKSKVAGLEQQISCMEDELSEARLEGSKLKTELVSERSSWEIKLSEYHSRVNELEEERLLSSGRTKIPGLKTRMELAWQKEREEQQRLLQETSTLARDLRQTLFEVERERDKERLEAKRKQDQVKKSTEEEQDENKRKLTELQCDLLELRDAHAKLRTTNEKLRREKERHEKEREELKLLLSGRRRMEMEDDRKISTILQQIETLTELAPELFNVKEGSTEVYTPTPPRRMKGPKSRESSPILERKEYSRESSMTRDDRKSQIHSIMQRLVDATEELKRSQRLNEEDREGERLRRVIGMRRATSTDHEGTPDSIRMTRGFARNGSTSGSLHRKSLSLEQTSGQMEQAIWKGDNGSLSSMQSLDMGSDVESRWAGRDTSLDSRLSGGSTQSEAAGVEKKKKKGIMGKLKKFTKSKSIDDQEIDNFSSTGPLSSKKNSNSDLNEDSKGSKKDLRDRISGIFKRGGSSSRSNSLERQKHDTSSTQRPLMPNGSNPSLPQTSPARNETSKISKSQKK